MFAGAFLVTQAGRARTSARTRSGWRTASRTASAAPIEMPPTTSGSLELPQKGCNVVGEGRDGELLERPSFGTAVAAAFQGQAAESVGKHFGRLRGIAAEPVLEHDG